MKVKSSYEYISNTADEWKLFQERKLALRELGKRFRDRASPKEKVVAQVVDIFSDGTRMTGTLWKPQAAMQAKDSSFPAVLMCHGWGGIRDNLDVAFARVFAQAGFVTLTFDYRGWNDSDGAIASLSKKPINGEEQELGRASDFDKAAGVLCRSLEGHIIRQSVDMDWQLTDIEAALSFLDGEPVVDSKRIGIWGISQGGGHVISIGARHPELVKAIVANVPSCGDVGAGTPKMRKEEARKDAARRARGLEPLSIPTNVPSGFLPHMDGVPNLFKLCRYRPLATAHLIECPILVIDADQEEVFDRKENGLAAFEIVKKRNPLSEYHLFSGKHYDAYDGPQGQYKEATKKAIEFFSRTLGSGENLSPSKL